MMVLRSNFKASYKILESISKKVPIAKISHQRAHKKSRNRDQGSYLGRQSIGWATEKSTETIKLKIGIILQNFW